MDDKRIPALMKGVDNGLRLDSSGECSSGCKVCEEKEDTTKKQDEEPLSRLNRKIKYTIHQEVLRPGIS